MSVFYIAMRNLMHRKVRTCFMVLFIALAAASLFTGTIIVKSIEERLDNTVARLGADIVIVPKEAESDAVERLFRGGLCSFYFDYSSAQGVLNNTKGIRAFSPQLFIATLNAVCCLQPTEVVAFDPRSDFIVKPWLEKLNVKKLQKGELIAGSAILANPGDTIKFFDQPFKVAGVLDKSGTGYDNCVFMDFETAHDLMKSPILQGKITAKTADNKSIVSAIMVRLEDGANAASVATKLNYSEKNFPLKAFTKSGIFTSVSDSVKQLSAYFSFINGLSFLFAALSLLCIFTITINERIKEFGILTVIGASRKQLVKIITSEALIMGIGGGAVGVLFSALMLLIFKDVIIVKLNVPSIGGSASMIAVTALKAFCTSLSVSLLSSLYSAAVISKEEPIKLIRLGE